MKNNISLTNDEVDYILSPKAIREKAALIFNKTVNGELHFNFHEEKIDDVVDYVIDVIKENYPDLNIPFHSRWGHFKVGGHDRLSLLNKKLKEQYGDDQIQICKAKLDLVFVSVLLDAGAGDNWTYLDKDTNETYSRSEGLAIASFNMFCDGVFSSDEKNPYQCENEKLKSFSKEDLILGFQVGDKNPLEGVEGRVQLINALGTVMPERPGDIYDEVGSQIPASALLTLILKRFGPIWPSRLNAGDICLGDVWSHPKLGTESSLASLVPFHKLSGWLSYSLMEPLMEAGKNINDLNSMTGLPEYRNGGLLLDSGLISLKDESLKNVEHLPGSELIIEWRALTIYSLDLIAKKLQEKLNFTADEFPLVKVLEGGTWWAGRKLAKGREGGGPPLVLKSDGTVF